MERVGSKAKAVVAGATRESSKDLQPAEPGTLPPGFVPETDRTIPDQTWNAFKPSGGEARTLRRPLQPDERRKLEHRAASLRPHLAGYARPKDERSVADSLAKMFNAFPSLKGEEESAAVTRLRGAMETLEEFPAWAIWAGCDSIRTKGYEVSKDGTTHMEQHWAPSEPELHRVIRNFVAPRASALRNAEQLLAAKVESAIEESPEQKAAAVARWQEQKAKMIGADQLSTLQAEAAEKRRIATVERNKTVVADSYRIAGVDMPEGTTSTFQMMLAMGWTVETVGGRKVLVSAPPGWRREMTR